jgi:anti-sigma B factor antagonist
MTSTLMNSQVVTFKPTGYVTAANVESFQNKLHREISQQNYAVFLVDMSEVVFLDSAGLMTIVRAFRVAQEMGKRFAICAITAPVKIIFELVRLDEFIEIYQDYREFEDSLPTAA